MLVLHIYIPGREGPEVIDPRDFDAKTVNWDVEGSGSGGKLIVRRGGDNHIIAIFKNWDYFIINIIPD